MLWIGFFIYIKMVCLYRMYGKYVDRCTFIACHIFWNEEQCEEGCGIAISHSIRYHLPRVERGTEGKTGSISWPMSCRVQLLRPFSKQSSDSDFRKYGRTTIRTEITPQRYRRLAYEPHSRHRDTYNDSCSVLSRSDLDLIMVRNLSFHAQVLRGCRRH